LCFYWATAFQSWKDSSARLPFDRVAALPGFRLSLLAAAIGPGRPGLLRGRQGGQEAGRA